MEPMSQRRRSVCRCVCECGAESTVRLSSLQKGVSRSCGCVGRSKAHAATRTHGDKGTAEYRAWCGMKERCKHVQGYKGRGITVCDRWASSYETFLQDVGRRPSPKYSLDRIDNNGNYEPGNVRWATRSVQQRNTRKTRVMTFGGVTKPLADWADVIGIGAHALWGRLRRGWSTEAALITPKGREPMPWPAERESAVRLRSSLAGMIELWGER